MTKPLTLIGQISAFRPAAPGGPRRTNKNYRIRRGSSKAAVPVTRGNVFIACIFLHSASQDTTPSSAKYGSATARPVPADSEWRYNYKLDGTLLGVNGRPSGGAGSCLTREGDVRQPRGRKLAPATGNSGP
ncbi:uncharacterized protein UV8b_07101 [Ustilaginoidea virens]|uniref:Uncharacterized protein n=1 Tax=Ustilaginoidea virens TaxID=1159556 RepID=A0A8E5HWU3_USTVR|nr:uncharacterized protein UV8b_07101 [Ustilaginoidea virens]QUC22860.1 hypothetical protein UV8b_07101 [Ustilaginoidea virens]